MIGPRSTAATLLQAYGIVGLIMISANAQNYPTMTACSSTSNTIFGFNVGTLDNKTESMSQYASNVTLVVNVATF